MVVCVLGLPMGGGTYHQDLNFVMKLKVALEQRKVTGAGKTTTDQLGTSNLFAFCFGVHGEWQGFSELLLEGSWKLICLGPSLWSCGSSKQDDSASCSSWL